MKSTVRITVPYAVANYVEMRERGFYYVDKTMFIPDLELYKAPVFLRPRRFGKSLLVSMLAAYYDLNMADRFTELFGDTLEVILQKSIINISCFVSTSLKW